MRLELQREDLLRPLQIVNGVVERRQTLPILANLLVRAEEQALTLVGTDLEVEMVARLERETKEVGEATLPARKLLDICRTLPEGATLVVEANGEHATVRSGKSRFRLATLPVGDFPSLEDIAVTREVEIGEGEFRRLIERTHFAMAQQDVRYYLNGLMLEVGRGRLRAVATDGHRLALSECAAATDEHDVQQIIVPRKGISELLRLLGDSDNAVKLELGSNHLRVGVGDMSLTSKLIDGRFPDYERVIPEEGDKILVVNRDVLRDALTRTSILSNEKYRGVRFNISDGVLRAQAHNPEQEEAEEEIEVQYDGESIEIGFNASYVLDALTVVETEEVKILLSDANSSCLIRPQGEGQVSEYVVMPMRL